MSVATLQSALVCLLTMHPTDIMLPGPRNEFPASFPGPQNWFLVKIHRDSFLRPQNEMGAIVRKVAGVATADSESPTR